jgi:hypothetical protein
MENDFKGGLQDLSERLDKLREAMEWEKTLGGRRFPGAVPLGGPARHARQDVLVAYSAFMSLAMDLDADLEAAAIEPDRREHYRLRLERLVRRCRELVEGASFIYP